MRTNNDALGLQNHNQLRSNLPPEARLILACARADAAAVPEDEVRELIEQPLDWPYLHRIALRNGQLPFLYMHLDRITPERIPADTNQALRAFSESIRHQNHFLLEVMQERMEVFRKNGFAAMPYVEALSSLATYGRPDIRSCTWLDFVVRFEDFKSLRELLRKENRWVELPDAAGQKPASYRWALSVWGYGPRESALSFHWAAAPWSRAIRLDLQEVWARRTSWSFGGASLPSLEPREAILHLCIQGSEYLWSSLQGIADIAEVVRRHPDLDWEGMLSQTHNLGMQRMLLTGMTLIRDLLEVPLPPAVAARIAMDRELPRLMPRIIRGLFNSTPHPNRTPEMLRMHLRLRERWADRRRYLWRYLVSPTELDRNLLPLPGGLQFLYPWLRPARLAGSLAYQLFGQPIRKAAKRSTSVSSYAPSGSKVVNRMLELAEVGPGDVVFDLGSGDGRIVIEAARRFGICGVGIDLDPQRIRESQENARHAGVEHLVRFEQGDVMKADLSTATVVMIYLPAKATLQLSARLMRELSPGARIVSHNSDLEGWDRVEACASEGFPSLLYLRKVTTRKAAGKSGVPGSSHVGRNSGK